MSSWCFLNILLVVLRMFAGFFQDVVRMLRWVLLAWWNLLIIINESMDFDDPKELDDPQLFYDPSYLMIPAIRWSPVIRWSLAIRRSIGSMDFDNPKIYGDTSIPIPEFRKCFFITFPFPNFGNGINHSRSCSQTPKSHPRSPLWWISMAMSTSFSILSWISILMTMYMYFLCLFVLLSLLSPS